MRPISPRPILTLSLFTTRKFKNSHFVSFSTVPHHQNPFSSLHPRREEESRGVRVSVWWDFENCNLPLNTNVFKVAQCITNATRANGIKGPIQITAFGDVMQISRTNQEALSSTGIILTHVPSGGKNSADRSLLVDLMYWVSQNPPPAHLFLISGDRDFAGILHRLRMNNYNILLASPDTAPSVLCSAATIMWQWSSLLKGENLTGKLFNQPPDGPYSSWYGHYKAPLEDPFAVVTVSEQQPSSEESSFELAPEANKPRPIPKTVIKQVSQILNSNPKGIPISQLRIELAKSNLTIDKDLYGHKKFTSFLLAMSRVLKINSVGDGNYLVQSVNNSGNSEVDIVCEPNGEKSYNVDVSEKFPETNKKAQVTSLQEARKEEIQKELSPSMTRPEMKGRDLKKEEKIHEQDKNVKLQLKQKKVEVAPPVVETKDSSEKSENQILITNEHSSAPEFGIFRRIWMKWFGIENTNSRKDNTEEKILVSNQSARSTNPALFSPSSHEALVDGKNAVSDYSVTNVPSQDSSLFNRALSWFRIRSSPKLDVKVEENREEVDQAADKHKQLDIFAKDSFWHELELFLDTPAGLDPFLQSKTREHLAQNLRKQGPPVLQSLSQSDLLHLIDLLITDKKWVEECNSVDLPFRLNRPSGKEPRTDPSSSSNGLRHLFSGKPKHQNPPHTGVPQRISSSKSSKSRSETLADCRTLVDNILKDYHEGFNIGSFRKVFLERHGYALDLQKLGYEKLVNLLQIMPGVRIESNLILPAGSFKNLDPQNTQESKSSGFFTKDGDSDSSWDELGPVYSSGPMKEEKDSRVVAKKGQRGRTREKVPSYEPLEEDDFSDSEDETESENESKSKLKDQDSSLLQILDSWHGRGESSVLKQTSKQKTGKTYSFVSEEPVGDSKDKLVDGILGSLKNSGERSAESSVSS